MHRDSEGNIQEIQPGAMNLMTAGRGIAHSERTPDVQRRDGQKMLGLQSWIALPAGSEEIAPSFQHYAAESLPTVSDGGFTARIIAGRGFGVKSPVTMVSPWFYTEVTATAGTSVPLDPDHEERAIYLVDGEVEIANERYEAPRLLIFRPGDRITVKALKPTRMMFLGGDALEGPRHIWWNFVSSSKERIEQAKQDWKTGRFAHVPEEHEFIPLPE
jgi:redox-sensitive bicupin YhaK (pirin superfamily)